jgi:hypothetical protein
MQVGGLGLALRQLTHPYMLSLLTERLSSKEQLQLEQMVAICS